VDQQQCRRARLAVFEDVQSRTFVFGTRELIHGRSPIP
jgi:hypothetical protein